MERSPALDRAGHLDVHYTGLSVSSTDWPIAAGERAGLTHDVSSLMDIRTTLRFGGRRSQIMIYGVGSSLRWRQVDSNGKAKRNWRWCQ